MWDAPNDVSLHYCQAPRGARSCSVSKTLTPPGEAAGNRSSTVFLSGTRIVIASSRAGSPAIEGTWLFSSTDGGQSFSGPRKIGTLDYGLEGAALGPGDAISGVNTVEGYQRMPLSGALPETTNPGHFVDVGIFGGTAPVVVTPTSEDGSFARYKGAGDHNSAGNWTALTPILPEPSALGQINLAGGPQGLVLLHRTADTAALIARKFTGSAFGPDVVVSEAGAPGGNDLFAQPVTGAFHAVWVAGDLAELRWATSTNGTSWSGPYTLVRGGEAASPPYSLRVAAAPDGQGFVVWDHFGNGGAITVAPLEPLAGGPGTPPPPPPPDITAPVISNHSMARRRFAVVGARTPRRRRATPRGSVFRYRLSEDARVAFTIERVLPGRRSTRRRACVPPERRLRRRPRCTRYKREGAFSREGTQGPNSVTFSGRIGRRALRPGRYRASLRATDAAGNRSRIRYLDFQVARY